MTMSFLHYSETVSKLIGNVIQLSYSHLVCICSKRYPSYRGTSVLVYCQVDKLFVHRTTICAQMCSPEILWNRGLVLPKFEYLWHESDCFRHNWYITRGLVYYASTCVLSPPASPRVGSNASGMVYGKLTRSSEIKRDERWRNSNHFYNMPSWTGKISHWQCISCSLPLLNECPTA